MPRGNTAVISVATFRDDWLSHIPMRALCEKFSISKDQVIRLKHVWHLPPRHDRKLRFKPVRQRDPTTTEIQQACLLIQATWSEEVREDRRVIKSQPVSLRRIEMTDEAWQEHDNMAGEVEP